MSQATIEVNGAHLAYELSGSGTPVVLVHGFSFDQTSWDAQFTVLAQQHRVLRYDLRGFGRSSLPGAAPYSHVSDLAELLRALELGPAHLVGLSLGANVALGLAVEQPGLVRSLVLASSGLVGHAWKGERPPDAAMAHARQHGVAAAKAFWLQHELFASVRAYPEAAARLAATVADYSGWHWANPNPMLPFTADAAQLPRVAAPTLVLVGGQDVPGYQEIGETLTAGIPGARKLVFPEAGHVMPLEIPQRFNQAVSALIGQVDAAG